MMAFLLAVHIAVCVGLIIIVLVQRGRGGGLVESFSGVESMFGTRTSAFLTRATTVLSIVFFLTCIGLAALSARRSRSLIPVTSGSTESAAAASDTVPPESAPAAESAAAGTESAPASTESAATSVE